MPQGYYTIEQWKPPEWVVAMVLSFGLSLTDAERALERLGKPGFYRLVHTQRIIWCEHQGSQIRLRKAHASSPRSLRRMQEMFDHTGGRYPAEEVQAARRAAKRAPRSKDNPR
jgi:hypothetical protein